MHAVEHRSTDDNTEQFKLHTTDTHKRKRIMRRIKLCKKDSSIDILTQYTIYFLFLLLASWLLVRPALPTVLFFETDILLAYL